MGTADVRDQGLNDRCMRAFHEFSAADWLRGEPAAHAFKQLRNDILLRRFLAVQQPRADALIETLRQRRDRHLLVSIAFRQPWALDWQLGMAARHVPDASLLVCDNSADAAASEAIRAVCERHGVPCVVLPPYRTRHVNRSHGMAMSWIYHRLVRAVEPVSFGFIDHDLIPVLPVQPWSGLRDQPVYGMRNAGLGRYWNLWAGYCHYRSAELAGRPLNFLYDFSRGLDTGGRNWETVYGALDGDRLRFAPQDWLDGTTPDGTSVRLELVDGSWLHIGGIGYGGNFERKFALHEHIRTQLDNGLDWPGVLAGLQTRQPRG